MNVRILLALLPHRHHQRYGDELDEMLRGSTATRGDNLDVALRIVIWNLEELMNRPWTLAASLVAGLSLFGLGYATADLARGLGEVHRHWWSSAPVVGLALAAGLMLLGRLRERSGRRST